MLTTRMALAAFLAAVAIAALAPSAYAATLEGYWQLEETLVTQPAADSSGNGLTGTYQGGVNPNVTGAPGFGSGADFDGSTGHLLLGPGDTTGLGTLQNDFTVMAWINPDGFGSKNRVMGAGPNAAWGWGTAGDDLQITTFGVKDYTQPLTLVAGQWAHAGVVLDTNNDAHFYLDGNFVGTQTHPTSGNTSTNNFYIGLADGTGEHFDGWLDEVGVFKGSLNLQQIQNAMNFGVANFEGPPGPPAPAPLKVDFNSTTQDGGPHNQARYEPYDAGHEVAADFDTKT